MNEHKQPPVEDPSEWNYVVDLPEQYITGLPEHVPPDEDPSEYQSYVPDLPYLNRDRLRNTEETNQELAGGGKAPEATKKIVDQPEKSERGDQANGPDDRTE